MTIYLDTNVYNRPFDDLSQERILEEAFAFIEIYSFVVRGTLKCISSDILKLEVHNTSDEVRRNRVLNYLAYCSDNVFQDELVQDLAKEIQIKCRLSSRDALHIASACKAKVDYFLTCDDKLVKKAKHICEILERKGYHLNIANPIDFAGMIRSE
ncbi:PIN domain-containing protein [bacterium]|nr:PIN domain-containing protein [bacterium]